VNSAAGTVVVRPVSSTAASSTHGSARPRRPLGQRSLGLASLAWLGIGVTQAIRTNSVWGIPAGVGLAGLVVLAGLIGRRAFLANARLIVDGTTLTHVDFRSRYRRVPLQSVVALKRLAVEVKPRTSTYFHYLVFLDDTGAPLLRISAPGWPLADIASALSGSAVVMDLGAEEQMSLADAARRYPGLFSWQAVHWQLLLVSLLCLVTVAVSVLVSIAR
jgi:hypothetical protein